MFSSRKFVASTICLLLIAAGYVATWPLPILTGSYPTFVGAVIGVLTAFCGANIGSQYVAQKLLPNPAGGNTEENSSGT